MIEPGIKYRSPGCYANKLVIEACYFSVQLSLVGMLFCIMTTRANTDRGMMFVNLKTQEIKKI